MNDGSLANFELWSIETLTLILVERISYDLIMLLIQGSSKSSIAPIERRTMECHLVAIPQNSTHKDSLHPQPMSNDLDSTNPVVSFFNEFTHFISEIQAAAVILTEFTPQRDEFCLKKRTDSWLLTSGTELKIIRIPEIETAGREASKPDVEVWALLDVQKSLW